MEGRLGFEDGRKKGGAVLFEEAAGALRRRQLGLILLGSVMAALPLLVAALLPPEPGTPSEESRWGMIGFAMAGGTFVLAIAAFHAGTATPFRLYERGISLGWGSRPFVPFGERISVEEDFGARLRTPYLVLALQDGDLVCLSKGPLRGRHIVIAHYDKVRDIMMGPYVSKISFEVSWDPAANEFVEGISFGKGPVRAVATMVAWQTGDRKVTFGLLAARWQEIASRLGPEFVSFRSRAEEAFGEGTMKSAKVVQ